jgi:multidrug efflux pump subunit AcrA (membrane-fusion protein)
LIKKHWEKLAIALGVIIVGGAILIFLKGSGAAPQTDAQLWARAEKGNILARISETGHLQAKTTVRVKANATGTVLSLKVKPGDKVRAGDVLAIIQPGRPGEQFKPSEVTAPMSGVVIDTNVQEGDTVTSGLSEYSGGTLIMTLADLKEMLVALSINEVDISSVRLGQRAEVSLDALGGRTFTASVWQLSPLAHVPSGSAINAFDAAVRILGTHDVLLPGMSARVDLVIQEKTGVLTLPVEAVFVDGDKNLVYLKTAKGMEEKQVSIGASDNDRVEITGGLAEGEEVSKVRPAEAAALALADPSKVKRSAGRAWYRNAGGFGK